LGDFVFVWVLLALGGLYAAFYRAYFVLTPEARFA